MQNQSKPHKNFNSKISFFLKSHSTGWPVVEGKTWQENIWSWQRIQLELVTRGFDNNYIFDCSVEMDMKNSSRKVIYVNTEKNIRNFYLIDVGQERLFNIIF